MQAMVELTATTTTVTTGSGEIVSSDMLVPALSASWCADRNWLITTEERQCQPDASYTTTTYQTIVKFFYGGHR